tara:strand:+ start:315 stop:470 length:156 start_codon:yes stop_codon:yes gene_type:complete
MPTTVWIAIGIIFIIVWGIIIWEIKNTPLTPDDYDIDEKEIWKELNKKNKK